MVQCLLVCLFNFKRFASFFNHDVDNNFVGFFHAFFSQSANVGKGFFNIFASNFNDNGSISPIGSGFNDGNPGSKLRNGDTTSKDWTNWKQNWNGGQNGAIAGWRVNFNNTYTISKYVIYYHNGEGVYPESIEFKYTNADGEVITLTKGTDWTVSSEDMYANNRIVYTFNTPIETDNISFEFSSGNGHYTAFAEVEILIPFGAYGI